MIKLSLLLNKLISTLERPIAFSHYLIMTFPNNKYETVGAFSNAYFDGFNSSARSVDTDRLDQAVQILSTAYNIRKTVFSCGNGGSAAISNHLQCDHLKGVQTDTPIKPRVISLSSTIETITAIANDISYDDVFLYQLQTMADNGDVLITISSSGDSENVVKAVEWALDNGLYVIALTGFTGGRTAKLAHVNLHVDGDNYGIIEDVHQSLMHILAQYIRMMHMPLEILEERKF
jgi:D-sedoheptulose 7-phosphate isomerase